MFGWLKKKIVASEANKIGFFRAFLDWLTAPGNRRIVVGCLIGLAAAMRHLDQNVPAEWIDQIKVIVDTLAPGMDAGAFALLVWSILAAKKKAKENAQ